MNRLPSPPTPYVSLTRTETRLSHAQSSNAPASLQNPPTIAFDPPDMIEYVHHAQRTVSLKPRTYWCEFPFYTIIRSGKQNLSFGYRPEDLASVETIEQKAWKKHQAHLSRLERFPLEKAEYLPEIKRSARYKERQGPCRGHGGGLVIYRAGFENTGTC